jgi:hypothetical protein
MERTLVSWQSVAIQIEIPESTLSQSCNTLFSFFCSPWLNSDLFFVFIFLMASWYHVTVENFSEMKAGDDAASAKFYLVKDFVGGQKKLAFDHMDLLQKLMAWKQHEDEKAGH